jgi:tetratricopeptide (TPR) repeat protein/DNA-binding CsgD family transcriptional regulator
MKLNYSILVFILIAIATFFPDQKKLQAQTDINVYTKKCNYYWRVNLDSAVFFGNRAVEIADKMTTPNDESSKANMFLGVTYYYRGNYDSAYYFVSKGLEIAENIGSEWGQGFGNNMLTIIMRRKGDFESSIEYAKKTIHIREKANDTVNLAGAYNNLATTYDQMGNLKDALENLILSLELRMKINDTIGMIMGHGNIANIYLKMDNIDLAKKHIDKSIALTAEGTLEYADNFLVLGDIMHNNYNKPDSALSLYKIALSIYTEIGIEDGIAVANENIGSTLLDLDKEDEAIYYMRLAKSIYENLHDSAQIAHINMSIGNFFRSVDNYDSSQYYLQQALILARKSNRSKVINESLGELYLLNLQFENLEKSIYYLEQLKNYSDSLKSTEAYDKMALLETKYKTAEKENTIIQLKYEKEKDRRHKAILYGAILFIITLIIAIAIFLYFRRKKELQLNIQKQQLLMSKKKLAEAELEKQKIKEQDMKKDIEHKARQLSSHALHMMQKSKMLHEVKEKIDETIKDVDPKYRQNLRQIARLIDKNLRTEQEWELFKMYFEQVNSSFYTNLKKHNPDLSQTDIRMCSLMKLGLNMKETASVLNVAPNTVKNARYRVKLKLGLTGDESLSEFIETL